MGKLFPADAIYSRLGNPDWVNTSATLLEEWSQVPLSQESDGITCSMRRPVERQKPTLGYLEYVWQ